MKKTTFKVAVLSLLAAILATTPSPSLAQDKPKTAEKKDAAAGEKKAGAIPFHGKIAAIDKTAKTITVGERVFEITSNTVIRKAGKPATLEDATVGDEIGGNYLKSDDGKLLAKGIRLGPKPDVAAKPAPEKKEK
jgi:hypothetical protein